MAKAKIYSIILGVVFSNFYIHEKPLPQQVNEGWGQTGLKFHNYYKEETFTLLQEKEENRKINQRNKGRFSEL